MNWLRGALVLSFASIVAGVAMAEEPHLSKLEARRFRQACERRATESSVKDGERVAFISQCYERRVSRRGEARECRAERAAAGVDAAHSREFMRECIQRKVEARK